MSFIIGMLLGMVITFIFVTAKMAFGIADGKVRKAKTGHFVRTRLITVDGKDVTDEVCKSLQEARGKI